MQYTVTLLLRGTCSAALPVLHFIFTRAPSPPCFMHPLISELNRLICIKKKRVREKERSESSGKGRHTSTYPESFIKMINCF